MLEKVSHWYGTAGVARVTEIHHTTLIHWVREAGLDLPDAPQTEEIPEIAELDELQTFVGNKRNKLWLWTAVNHWCSGILAWVVGDRSAKTFKPLWAIPNVGRVLGTLLMATRFIPNSFTNPFT